MLSRPEIPGSNLAIVKFQLPSIVLKLYWKMEIKKKRTGVAQFKKADITLHGCILFEVEDCFDFNYLSSDICPYFLLHLFAVSFF